MPPRQYDFDYILEHIVGSAGPWQYKQYLLLLLQNAAGSFPFMLHLYAAYVPEHRCFVQICDQGSNNDSFRADHVQFSIPLNENRDTFLKKDQELSPCQMYKPSNGYQDCVEEAFNHSAVQFCQKFVYDRRIFVETLATRLDLVCGDDYKIELLGTILMVGVMVGCLLGGLLGDKIGRKKTLVCAITVMAPVVIIEGFVPIYAAYATFRFIVFTCISIMWVTGHALTLELFGPRHRKMAYVFNGILFSITILVLPLIAYLERHWTKIHLYIGILALLTLPFLWLFMAESVRWLVLNGRHCEAESMLLQIAKANEKYLTHDQIREMNHILMAMVSNAKEEKWSRLNPLTMLKPTYLKNTLIVLSIWVTSVTAFYALTLNVTILAGDIFLNFVIASVADMPATLFIYLFLDRMGRRFCIITNEVALGGCCIGMAFLPKDSSTAIYVLYLIGKFSSNVSLSLAWFYTAELYPTNLRAQAVGTCSLVARIFGMCATFVTKLDAYWTPLPGLVLGVPAVIAGLLTYFLPETKGKDLVETTKAVEVNMLAMHNPHDDDTTRNLVS